LNETERKAVLDIANSPEYCDLSPRKIVPLLADKGLYIASESTFYRILRSNNNIRHRYKWKVPSKRNKPSLLANAPNKVWSWDISFLRSNIRGKFFYLYLFMDIFSRKIVGWDVLEKEDSNSAANILRNACLVEGINKEQLVLHSDNGAAMKGSTMLATLHWLGIIPSFSRPRTSNDNCFSESLFRTMKYSVHYPETSFKSLQEAYHWVLEFVNWYNNENMHSGINYVTPNERHQRMDIIKLQTRKIVYEKAYQENPLRWRRKVRNWKYQDVVHLNPINEEKCSEEKMRHHC